MPEPLDYAPAPRTRYAPRSRRRWPKSPTVLVAAERPVIYAGQGVHYAQAWDALRELAELLEAPVTTSLEGKSAFPENHPLSLGVGRPRRCPKPVRHFLEDADVIFGIGCSFATTDYGVRLPRGKTDYIHATLDPADINKDIPVEHALVGDAELTLRGADRGGARRLEGQAARPRGRRRGRDRSDARRRGWSSGCRS